MLRLALSCAVLLAAGCAWAAEVPALQVDRVQGPVQVQRMGQHLGLHAGDVVVARDVVELGKGARLTLSLANRGLLQLAGAGEISVEQLSSATAAGADAGPDPIPVPIIVSFERGDMHLLWHPDIPGATSVKQAQQLYVYFAQRRVALQPGEYFFRQQQAGTQICVAEGQAETMTIAAGQRQLVAAHDCEIHEGQTTRILARNAEVWPRMRQRFAFADGLSGDIAGKPAAAQAVAQMDSKLAETSQLAAVPAPAPSAAPHAPSVAPHAPSVAPHAPSVAPHAPSATAASNGNHDAGSGWAINVASYSTADKAQQQRQQLQASGYPAVVVTAKVDGRTWYRVQVSGFPTPAAAHATAVALKTKLGYQRLWVMKHP